MILDSVNKSLEVLLGEAIAASNCDITAGWADYTATTFTPGGSDTVSNGTTAVTAVAAPAAATQRMAMEVTVHNNDTIPHLITLRLNNSGTFRIVRQQVLARGEDFSYAPAAVPRLRVA